MYKLFLVAVFIIASYLSMNAQDWQSNNGNLFFNNGNVGIGTSEPSHSLNVLKSDNGTNASIKIDHRSNGDPNGTGTAELIINAYYAGALGLLANKSGHILKGIPHRGIGLFSTWRDFSFTTSNNGQNYIEAMRLRTNGNAIFNQRVGIGTNSPGSELDVVGSGWFYPGGENDRNRERARVLQLGLIAAENWRGPGFSFYTHDDGGSNEMEIVGSRWGTSFYWSRGSSDGIKKVAHIKGVGHHNYFELLDSNDESSKVRLISNGSSYINGGSVGIGTSNPNSRLHLWSGEPLEDDNTQDLIQMTASPTENNRGSKFGIRFSAPSADGLVRGSAIYNVCERNWSNTNGLAFHTSDGPNSQPAERMRITSNGKVLIGRTSLGNNDFKLAVTGGVLTEKVKVELVENWPDYVFEDGYQLRSLNEVESYINKNSHLPDVPAATELEGNGFDLAKMDATLLQKIEELTLYIIEQEKRMVQQEERIKKLEEKL